MSARPILKVDELREVTLMKLINKGGYGSHDDPPTA